MTMSKKKNYEYLLSKIEKLEQKVEVLEFLRKHTEEDIVITKEPEDGELNVYANFLNYEKDKIIKLFLYAKFLGDKSCYTEEVVQHDKKPFRFIEVRSDGILQQVFKVDKFLEAVWVQDLSLYAKAYNVKVNIYELGGSEIAGKDKRNSRKVDVD